MYIKITVKLGFLTSLSKWMDIIKLSVVTIGLLYY